MAHDGSGIGFLPGNGRGKAVFISGALPGQIIDCTLIEEKSAFCRARLDGIVWEPANFSNPLCPHLAECGGCSLQRLPYQAQLAWKEKLAKDALERIGRMNLASLDAAWTKTIQAPRLKEYRNKAELAFGLDPGGNFALGFRKQGSHTVFNLQACPLLPEKAVAIAAHFRTLAKKCALPPYDGKNGFWRFLVLRQTLTQDGKENWRTICLTSPADAKNRKLVADCGEKLMQACPDVDGFIHETRRQKDFLTVGEKRVCCLNQSGQTRNSPIHMQLGGKTYKLDTASFFQVNTSASGLLVETASAMDRESGASGSLLDLYCGVGAPGLLLAERHESYTGLEIDKKAIAFARINAENFGLMQCRFAHWNAAKPSASLIAQPGTHTSILADPPRSGLAPPSLNLVTESGASWLVYISCNPVTLARDAATLQKKYELARLTCVDMFPHTPHLECASLWRKR